MKHRRRIVDALVVSSLAVLSLPVLFALGLGRSPSCVAAMQGVGIGQWWEETRRHVAEAIEAGGSLTSANVGPNAVVLLSCINYVQPCTAADHSDCMLPDRLRLMSLVLLRSFPTSKFSVAQDADEAGSFVQYLGQVVVVWTVREAGAPSMLMAYAVG